MVEKKLNRLRKNHNNDYTSDLNDSLSQTKNSIIDPGNHFFAADTQEKNPRVSVFV